MISVQNLQILKYKEICMPRNLNYLFMFNWIHIFVFYCYITNDHKLGDLKHPFTNSEFCRSNFQAWHMTRFVLRVSQNSYHIGQPLGKNFVTCLIRMLANFSSLWLWDWGHHILLFFKIFIVENIPYVPFFVYFIMKHRINFINSLHSMVKLVT